jgi:hypothetical protein
MTSGSPNGQPSDPTAQLIPQQVAELAAELTEAQSPSRRKRLARQIPELASKSRRASWRGLQSGSQVPERVKSGGRLSARSLRSGSQASARGLKATGQTAWSGVQTGGQTAWNGVTTGGQLAWQGFQTLGQRLSGQVLTMAPKVPIRSLDTLRHQYPGRPTEEMADALIEGASRASAGVGAAVGAAAAMPFVPTVAVELGVETLALVAVELKLIAELHEVYGMPAPGNNAQRMLAYVGSWANRRGVTITTEGMALAIGSPLRRKLEKRLISKAGQSALSLAPLLAGAAAGAAINHRETRKLGNQIRDDLRSRSAAARGITS